MKSKNTDRIFREQLEDFQQEPEAAVWHRINESLDLKKKRRKIIPFWWKLGGAAAVLLLAVYLLSPDIGQQQDVPSITNSEKTTPDSPMDSQTDNELSPPGQEVVATDKTQEQESTDTGNAGGSVRDENTNEVLQEHQNTATPLRELPSPAQQSGIASNREITPDKERMGNKERTDNGVPAKTLAETKSESGRDISNKAIAELIEEESQKESALVESQAKEELLGNADEEDEIVEPDASNKRWSVGPSLAPVFFNSFGNGSPISQNFVANSKSGTVNMSYGLNLSYEVSKKLSLRTGIHRVDYGYNTGEVAFTSSPSAGPSSLIRTISYSENSKTLVVQSAANNNPQLDAAAADVAAPSPAREGNMLQEFGYLELPLEMQYNLVDKKWGLNLIGGMSSLFLINNSVSLQSEGAATEIGEATNMNDVNFSTNLGLGIYYNLSPTMRLNMQPIFKYQLNTFSETAGNFNPYSIGIYSGLNFKF
ncbi:outer membrane beta-barrel protein [Robiginitalea sp. IMCC44478]|uniref:outer membrane beta-barrel protein n=1 Tax=Robiginitalea sp. IMCC44478 TaxID=3459122 RepID=UPI00404221E9